jgi:myo-inositol 2-dehydrogenase/D-chiro-inositol 1-dehydrogenase
MFIDRFRPAYENELRAFLRVARGDEESACTARDGLEAVRVAVAATRSLREHRPVRISEVT